MTLYCVTDGIGYFEERFQNLYILRMTFVFPGTDELHIGLHMIVYGI